MAPGDPKFVPCRGIAVKATGQTDLVHLKKNMNASRPSEHSPVRGRRNVKTFRWDHRLQIQNLFMAFKRVLQW